MDGRKLVFISGKYTAQDDFDIGINITAAENAGLKLYLMGYDVIIPHANTRHWERDDRVTSDNYPDRVLEMDMNILGRCDAIYMLRGWKDSPGAVAEHARALELSRNPDRKFEIWYEAEPEAEMKLANLTSKNNYDRRYDCGRCNSTTFIDTSVFDRLGLDTSRCPSCGSTECSITIPLWRRADTK